MKIVFLGTNGWFDTNTGNTTCILVETDRFTIILDAGNGIFKLDRYIDFSKPAYLFLSHFHLDHIAGLHIINKFNFSGGLFICGQKGIKAILDKIINKPFTIPIKQLKFKTKYIELPTGQKAIPFKVVSLPLVHSAPTLGYRLEVDNKVLAFCTDTGYCKNAVKLSKAADLLIAECSFKSGQEEAGWPHLNPELAARIAKEASVKKMSLIHFDADVYKAMDDRKQSEISVRKVFDNSFVAQDDMVIEV